MKYGLSLIRICVLCDPKPNSSWLLLLSSIHSDFGIFVISAVDFFNVENNYTAFKSFPSHVCILVMHTTWHLQSPDVHLPGWCSQHGHKGIPFSCLTLLADVCICVLGPYTYCYSLSVSVSWFHIMFHSLNPARCQYAREIRQKDVIHIMHPKSEPRKV